MSVKDALDENSESTIKKQNTSTEKISKNGNPKNLHPKSKPDDGMVELEGGFVMYPAEILDFSEGTDSD
jgi:hypothetical protein